VELPRATLATRLVLADSLILPVIDLLRGRFAATDIRQMDEMPVQALNYLHNEWTS
jgi:hypothetical protein